MNLYPTLNLRSKNDFAKRIVSKKLTLAEAKILISHCKQNKDDYWHDYSEKCEPEKEKYMRSAYKKMPLYKLLQIIDKKLLAPFDANLPYHIYGGRHEISNLHAAKSLLNHFKKRWLLKLDLKRFFEQVSREKVFKLFYHKCNCKMEFSNYVADICCVAEGHKGSQSRNKCLARGFAPSTRLAIWTNLEFFMQLRTLVRNRFDKRQNDPRLAIFIDDIGITASNTDRKSLEQLRDEIVKLAKKYGLEINQEKTKIYEPGSEQEILGVLLHSRTLGFTQEKETRKKQFLKQVKAEKNDSAKRKFRGLMNYKKQIQKLNSKNYRTELTASR